MTTTDILALAQETVSRLGIIVTNPAAILHNLQSPGETATGVCGGGRTLWVGRDYIAYGDNRKPEFTYVFCTAGHAAAELRRVEELLARARTPYAVRADPAARREGAAAARRGRACRGRRRGLLLRAPPRKGGGAYACVSARNSPGGRARKNIFFTYVYKRPLFFSLIDNRANRTYPGSSR